MKVIPLKQENRMLLHFKNDFGHSFQLIQLENTVADCGLEIGTFSGREQDNFKGYKVGKGSENGYLIFDHYIVDLDECVPNPYF